MKLQTWILFLFLLKPFFALAQDQTQDPYLWLEERDGAQARSWVEKENNISRGVFESDPRFQSRFEEVRDLITSTDKIPTVQLVDGLTYNLWQDESHPRGIWRRTSLQDYKNPAPHWEILLDIDQLARQENQPWVFKGAVRLRGSDHCLVTLSKNGQDAVEYREFSFSQKQFVAGGFTFPESKSNIIWLDADHLLVASALSPEQKTESGYARKIYYWSRGEDFSNSKLIFAGETSDVSVEASLLYNGSRGIPVVSRMIDYSHIESFALDDQLRTHKIPLPEDTYLYDAFKDHVFLLVKNPWKGFPSGTLLAAPITALTADDIPAKDLKVVYAPTDKSSFAEIAHTKDRLYLLLYENVRGKVYEAIPDANFDWQLQKIFPDSASSFSVSASDEMTDAALFEEEGYLQPRRLLLKEKTFITEAKKSKSYFDESRFVAEQFWVASRDGVKIPYTVVRAKDLKYDGSNPTLLYGYGGFEVSMSPYYGAVTGKEWLEKGGVYVVANIRGGGEFGPQWHLAAVKEHKQKSYDDFIAVAEDLIRQKITSPSHLGIQGGSNGGLLVGAVAMQRPELFNAVVCQVPLLDMIRYTKLPPGASWVDEYGDPDDPKMREVILKYSPYQNVSKDKKYPKIFFQTTKADDRVHPGHARKMAARLEELGHPTLFFEAKDGGHGEGVQPDDLARTIAYIYVYLSQQLMP